MQQLLLHTHTRACACAHTCMHTRTQLRRSKGSQPKDIQALWRQNVWQWLGCRTTVTAPHSRNGVPPMGLVAHTDTQLQTCTGPKRQTQTECPDIVRSNAKHETCLVPLAAFQKSIDTQKRTDTSQILFPWALCPAPSVCVCFGGCTFAFACTCIEYPPCNLPR